jgi:hypothetical protein
MPSFHVCFPYDVWSRLPTYPCPSSCLSQSLNGISVSKAVLVHKALAETEAASVLEVSRGSGPVQEVSTLLPFSYPCPLSSAPPVLPSSRPLLRPSPRPPFLCSSRRHVPWLPLFSRASAAAMNKKASTERTSHRTWPTTAGMACDCLVPILIPHLPPATYPLFPRHCRSTQSTYQPLPRKRRL